MKAVVVDDNDNSHNHSRIRSIHGHEVVETMAADTVKEQQRQSQRRIQAVRDAPTRIKRIEALQQLEDCVDKKEEPSLFRNTNDWDRHAEATSGTATTTTAPTSATTTTALMALARHLLLSETCVGVDVTGFCTTNAPSNEEYVHLIVQKCGAHTSATAAVATLRELCHRQSAQPSLASNTTSSRSSNDATVPTNIADLPSAQRIKTTTMATTTTKLPTVLPQPPTRHKPLIVVVSSSEEKDFDDDAAIDNEDAQPDLDANTSSTPSSDIAATTTTETTTSLAEVPQPQMALTLSLATLERAVPLCRKQAAWVAPLLGWDRLALQAWYVVHTTTTTTSSSGMSPPPSVQPPQIPAWLRRRYHADFLIANALTEEERSHNDADYVPTLVSHVLRRREGQAVATGLHRYYYSQPKGHDDDDGACRRRRYRSTLRSVAQGLVPRDTAVIGRAVLRHALAPSSSSSSTTTEWVDDTCRVLWGGDGNKRTHLEHVCRLIVLSSSSIVATKRSSGDPTTPIVDGSLGRAFAQVLSRLAGVTGEGEQELSNTEEFDGDNESDSDNDGDLACSPHELRSIAVQDRLLYHILSEVGVQWSQTTFVRQTDALLQAHVAAFVTNGLSTLASPPPLASNLAVRLLQGVTLRLESIMTPTRRDGMRVAEALARYLGKEVKFEELNNERDCSDILTEHQNEVTSSDKAASSISLTNSTVASNNFPKCTTKDEEDHNSDWDTDNDSVLDPYDLDDDEEDLRDVPRPLYLNECLDYLRAPETDELIFSRHEAALKEISTLVRSRPADLADLGPELARNVLRLENKWNIEKFSDLVSDSLCALLVEDPMAVGTHLIEEMFQDGTLGNRLTVLHALDNAAMELSGFGASMNVKKLDPIQGPRVSGKSKLVPMDATISTTNLATRLDTEITETGSRTRRWGHGSRRPTESKSVTNRFKDVAPVWMYSLIGKFMATRESPDLWGDATGSKLLSFLFLSMSRMVQCCGPHAPGVDVLAQDLFDLVWTFRTAEVPEIRASVLYAVEISLGSLRPDMLVRVLLNRTNDNLVDELHSLSQDDPNEECRSLAHTIQTSVAHVLQQVDQAALVTRAG